MVRTGINLYGAYDPFGSRAVRLDPVIELKTRLVSVRTLPAGMTIGYERTYELKDPMRIGTISIGYADGLPFGIAGKGKVSVRGRGCPVIGRISMDFTTICLDQVPEAQVGDEVICLGGDLKVDDWAKFRGTNSYDVICSLGSRVERRYV